MTHKTKHQIRQEKRHASFFKDWQRLTSNPNNKKTAIMETLANKYEISVKTAYDWRNRMINA